VDSSQLPRFYHLHRPGGSPRSKFPGLAPTGPLPESIDFPLYRSTEKDTFDVLLFADPQVAMDEEIDFVRDDVAAELIGADIDFGIMVGDIMYDDLSLFERYNAVVAGIGVPFHNVPGNHDMNYDSTGDEFSLETFQKYYGPAYYAFEVGKVSFIVLDTVDWLGPKGSSSGHYRGRLGERQLRWLGNYLKHVPDDRLIVMTMHIPFYCVRSDGDRVNVIDRAELFGLVEDRRHLLAIAGHMHVFEYDELGPEQGWHGRALFPQVCCAAASGSWWNGPKDERGIPTTDQQDGSPNGYHMFHFEGTDWSQRYKAAGFGDEYQLRISSPAGVLSGAEADTAAVVVNVFSGTKRWTVEASIDRGEYVRMTQTVRTDPYFEKIRHDYAALFPEWVEAWPSSHIWLLPLPDGLGSGVHTIRVRAVDDHGRSFIGGRVFEIE
jgi:3',5'-cyclic AMP phosphodiesterase CpdA